MKLSKETVNILNNIAKINTNFFIEKDSSSIKTMNHQGTVFCAAGIEETFPVDVGIYDLQEFLSIAQLQGNASLVELDLSDKKCVLSFDSGYSCEYWYASKEVLKVPENMIKMPPSVVEFVLESDVITTLRNAAQKLSKPSIAFTTSTTDPSKVVAKVFDPQNASGNVFSKTIELAADLDCSFDFVFNLQNLKYLMENEDYAVKFAAKGKAKISSFATLDSSIYDLTYYLGLDSSSTLNGE